MLSHHDTHKHHTLRPYQRSELMSFAILATASASISAASFLALGWPL